MINIDRFSFLEICFVFLKRKRLRVAFKEGALCFERKGNGMEMNEKCIWLIGEILIQRGWLSWEQLENALAVQQDATHPLGEILVENSLVSQENLYQALAEQFAMVFMRLANMTVEPAILRAIPKDIAQQKQVMPLFRKKDILLVAISDPRNRWQEAELCEIAGAKEIRMVLATPEDIEFSIARHYGPEELAA